MCSHGWSPSPCIEASRSDLQCFERVFGGLRCCLKYLILTFNMLFLSVFGGGGPLSGALARMTVDDDVCEIRG